MDGIHLAAFTGSVLCACAALAVLKFMPHQIEQHGAMHDAVSAAEDVAELGLGGALPVFADTAFERGRGNRAGRRLTEPSRPGARNGGVSHPLATVATWSRVGLSRAQRVC